MSKTDTQDAEQILAEAMEIITSLGPLINMMVGMKGKVATIREMGKTISEAARERSDEGDEDIVNTMAMTIVALIIERTESK